MHIRISYDEPPADAQTFRAEVYDYVKINYLAGEWTEASAEAVDAHDDGGEQEQ